MRRHYNDARAAPISTDRVDYFSRPLDRHESKGARALGAGVEVRNRKSGTTNTIECSELPRFYIWGLERLAVRYRETPIGVACLK